MPTFHITDKNDLIKTLQEKYEVTSIIGHEFKVDGEWDLSFIIDGVEFSAGSVSRDDEDMYLCRTDDEDYWETEQIESLPQNKSFSDNDKQYLFLFIDARLQDRMDEIEEEEEERKAFEEGMRE